MIQNLENDGLYGMINLKINLLNLFGDYN
jgi:hypothetical protein